MRFYFGFEDLQGIWWRHFSWQTVPHSFCSNGKRLVITCHMSCVGAMWLQHIQFWCYWTWLVLRHFSLDASHTACRPKSRASLSASPSSTLFCSCLAHSYAGTDLSTRPSGLTRSLLLYMYIWTRGWHSKIFCTHAHHLISIASQCHYHCPYPTLSPLSCPHPQPSLTVCILLYWIFVLLPIPTHFFWVCILFICT